MLTKNRFSKLQSPIARVFVDFSKYSVIVILTLIGADTSATAQIEAGLYGRAVKKTSIYMPDFKTSVTIEEDERFGILNAYKTFFLVEYPPQGYISRKTSTGYILQKDVETFIFYQEKKPGSLQSFWPATDLAYAEEWNDSTINAWKKIAHERNYKERKLLLDDETLKLLESFRKVYDSIREAKKRDSLAKIKKHN